MIDQPMTRLIADDGVSKLYKKWLQRPVPPNGVNLDVLMGYSLRGSFNTPMGNVGN